MFSYHITKLGETVTMGVYALCTWDRFDKVNLGSVNAT